MFKKIKGKKWVNKILKADGREILPITCDSYIHELDRKTLSALKKIPLFDKICNKYISLVNEPMYNIMDMSSKIRIGKKQVPKIYHMVSNISKKLGIDMPNLYLELDRRPNAYTYGSEKISITVTSGLLECLTEDEIYAVLAHECGHIACKHVLYHTMGAAILNGSILGASLFDNNGLITAAIALPLKLAFYKWMKCSELSADRAAVICCRDAKPVTKTMMRLAGGTTHIETEIDEEMFIGQAADYKILTDESKWNKTLEFLHTYNHTHPLLSIRAHEAYKWAESAEFKNLISNKEQRKSADKANKSEKVVI